MTQEKVICKVIDILEENNIQYMLTGGIVVNYYGRPRFTHDVDLIIQIHIEDAEKIVTLFEKEFYISKDGVIEAIKCKGMFNLIHFETIFKVDCFILKDEEHSMTSFPRRQKELIFGREIYIASCEDIILTKLYWYKKSGIQKHYEDVVGIFEIQQNKIDLDYVKKWAEKLSFLEIIEEILKQINSKYQ